MLRQMAFPFLWLSSTPPYVCTHLLYTFIWTLTFGFWVLRWDTQRLTVYGTLSIFGSRVSQWCVCVCSVDPLCPTLWSNRMRYEDHSLGTFCPLFLGEPSSLGQPHPRTISPSQLTFSKPPWPQAMAMSIVSFAESTLGRAWRSAGPSSFTELV